MWDVIVVGARPAGAAAALRFARSGRKVLLLDKARPGADTLSTHVLLAPALAQLAGLGLLDAMRATGAPPVRHRLFSFEQAAYARPIRADPGYLLCIRRPTFDPILVAAAQRASAVVRYQTRVEGLLWQNSRVVGVHGRDQAGLAFSERGRLVIGADGRHSLVARQVHAAEYNALDSPSAALYAYFEQMAPPEAATLAPDADALQFASGPDCDALCCPCDGGLHVVLLFLTHDEFGYLHAGDGEAYESRLREIPALAPRLARARRASRLHPVHPRDLRGFFRGPFGPGWALVGDAGYCPHPALARGIGDALRSAELLHAGVERAWAAGQAAETHLSGYQAARDAENEGPFSFSYRLGRVNPWRDPLVAALLASPLDGLPPAGPLEQRETR